MYYTRLIENESNHVKSNFRSIILSFKNLTKVDGKVYWSIKVKLKMYSFWSCKNVNF